MDTLKTIPFTIALFVIGAIFLLLGLTGGLTIGSYSLVFQETLTRVISSIVGAILVGLAIIIESRFKTNPKQTDPQLSQAKIQGTSISADKFFYTLDEKPGEGFPSMVKDATRIQIPSRTAVNLLSHYQKILEQIGTNGCEIQLLFVDPLSEVAKYLYGSNPEIYQNNITSTVHHLNKLKQVIGHRLQVRVTRHAPTLSIINVEKENLGEGFTQVQLYFLHGAVGMDRPIFRVNQNDKWRKIFRDEFSQIWSESKEWDFAKYIRSYLKNGRLRLKPELGASQWILQMNNGQQWSHSYPSR